jgi:DNA replication protein DnaC
LADVLNALATTVDRPNAGSAITQQVTNHTEPAHFSMRDGHLLISTARRITGPGYSNYWASTLAEHTLDQLRTLRLDGMLRALEEQSTSTAAAGLSFEDRLTLLVQREVAWRDNRRVARLLKAAKLKVSAACVEDIDWRTSRGLDRALITSLAGGDWIRHGRNLLITGATGCGKTWLACALAHQAVRGGFSALYVRAARLFEELKVAHGDGSFTRRLAQLAKLDVLVIDDFALSPIGAPERNDLLELLDDRVGTRSTIVTSQVPVRAWHTYLNDPTLADAILDRVVHSSHKIELKVGKSMRDTDGADKA